MLKETANFSFLNGNSLALADEGGTVSAWTNAGSGFTRLMSAADSSFAVGTVAVEGSGSNTRLTNLRFGTLQPKAGNMNVALGELRLDDAFATSETPLSEGGAWAPLSWDYASSIRTGHVVAGQGWGPSDAWETIHAIDGAYWTTASFADTGAGDAVAATLTASPALNERHLELLLDMPNPATAQSGYELRFTETGANSYTVSLARVVAGTVSPLVSKAGVSIPVGGRIALSDKSGGISAWTAGAAGEYTQLLAARDSTFVGGYSGVAGGGNNTRLTNFRSGQLDPS